MLTTTTDLQAQITQKRREYRYERIMDKTSKRTKELEKYLRLLELRLDAARKRESAA